jgi:carbonic anhydrase
MLAGLSCWAGAWLAPPAWGSEGHGEAPAASAAHAAKVPKPGKPDTKAEPREGKDPKGDTDLGALRERLTSRLAEAQARGERNSVVRVTNSGADHGPAPSRAKSSRRPSAVAAKAESAPASAPAHAEEAHAPGAAHVHWSYLGEGGPSQWAALKSEFATCGLGKRQSPIDIRGGIRVDLEPIRFDYHPSAFSVIDNGHTVQANIAGNNSIEVGGRRYDLLQFHFHRPSEERVNGRQYDMVIHLVHKDPEGRLAVVALLLEQGRAQPAIQMVWNSLPLEKNQENPAPTPLDLNLLLPEDRRYYTYMGSLTTPPCSEGVLWLVMKQPVPIAADQVSIFARLYPMNARPIQPSAGRLIKESN